MNSRPSTALIALSLIAGGAGAQSTQAVEWKVSEGGNGHWYLTLIDQDGMTKAKAQEAARRLGGKLLEACGAEFDWFYANTAVNSIAAWRQVGPSQYHGPYIGLSKIDGSFAWPSGEACVFDRWDSSEPTNNGIETAVMFFRFGTPPNNRCHDVIPSSVSNSAAIEWDSDCNGDGIVDYGQIRSGQLVDLNSNGVPDVCETSITGVQPVSGPAQGGTAINILGNNLPENPSVSIGGVAALNVVRLSASRITAVTPPNLPGVADVTVNSWTSQNAFYYRPECGSDLDQDGEVTAADIAIVLLDFGPCYSNAANTQPDDSTPFMLQDQPAPASPQRRFTESN